MTGVGELQWQQLAKLERQGSTGVNDVLEFGDEVCKPKLTGAAEESDNLLGRLRYVDPKENRKLFVDCLNPV